MAYVLYKYKFNVAFVLYKYKFNVAYVLYKYKFNVAYVLMYKYKFNVAYVLYKNKFCNELIRHAAGEGFAVSCLGLIISQILLFIL